MPHIYAQVRIPHSNGLPADAVINTFHFTGTDDVADMCTAIRERLTAFYNVVPSGATNSIKNYLSTELSITGTRVKMYDWDDPEPRAPVFDESLSLTSTTPVAQNNLPGEVALCTSYAAPAVSGQIASRRRGRLYIGPLNAGANLTTINIPSRPLPAFRVALAEATEALAAASTLGARWVVWSRVNSSASGIERGWVDDAWDTQRRRGIQPTARLTWEVEIP